MTAFEAEVFESELSQAQARRLEAITLVRRAVKELSKTSYESTCTSMALPMLYAHWEGFVKEVLQLFLEEIESKDVAMADADPYLVAHSWTAEFRRVKGGASIDQRAQFVRKATESLHGPLKFGATEKEIDTKSNLNFAAIESLCKALCLDTALLEEKRHHMNALVSKRNSIAHGGRHEKVALVEVEETADLVVDLINRMENILLSAVRSGR